MKGMMKMINLIFSILILSFYHSFLFYHNQLGFNILLFIIPLLIFLYNVFFIFDRKRMIHNRFGLLFLIPIILLSISYFIYDNYFFQWFNIIIITLTFFLMYLFTIKPTSYFSTFLSNLWKIAFYPFSYFEKYYKLVTEAISSFLKLSDFGKRKMKSIIVVLPIVIIVFLLLSSADMIFSSIFDHFFKLFKGLSFDNIFSRGIQIAIIFTYLGSSIYYILYVFTKEKEKQSKEDKKIDHYTIKILLISLNVLYVIFDFIQIRSLIFHQGLKHIHYAEYARSGFFQLMFISLINIIILLLSKKADKDTNFNKMMSSIMIFLTFIIIVSSFMRMYMYESAYGYTLLRLLVYVILITEAILLIPTFIYVLNPKINILKYYIVIVYIVYTLLSLSPVDSFIAKNNVERYYKKGKIDVYYLLNSSTDNIPILCDLYQDENIEQKELLRSYLQNTYNEIKNDSLVEFNLSRNRAVKEIERVITK